MAADVCNVLKWAISSLGLKILGPARGVWVRFPSPALKTKHLQILDLKPCVGHFAYFLPILDPTSFWNYFESRSAIAGLMSANAELAPTGIWIRFRSFIENKALVNR